MQSNIILPSARGSLAAVSRAGDCLHLKIWELTQGEACAWGVQNPWTSRESGWKSDLEDLGAGLLSAGIGRIRSLSEPAQPPSRAGLARRHESLTLSTPFAHELGGRRNRPGSSLSLLGDAAFKFVTGCRSSSQLMYVYIYIYIHICRYFKH